MNPINHVAIINRSRGLLSDASLAAIVEAYRAELPAFAAAWGIPAPGIAVYPGDHAQDAAEEAVIFVVNSAGDDTAFGAHTLLGKYVWGYVDAALSLARQEAVSRVIGHELFELLADPGLDRWIDVGGGERVAVEVCDPVQRQSQSRMASFFGQSAVVEIADYCLPSWFQPGAAPPYDRMDLISKPLVLAPGGYIVRRQAGVLVADGAAGFEVGYGGARITSFGRSFRRMAQRL